jgi:ATP-dependent DNA helicase RecG
MWNLLEKIDDHIEEYLPDDFVNNFDLLDVKKTIKNIHYPEDLETKKKAINRIFFDRLLRIQLLSLINKKKYQEKNIDIKNKDPNRDLIKNFIEKLPFQLTNAQKKVTKSIIENFHDIKPMIRLLQ